MCDKEIDKKNRYFLKGKFFDKESCMKNYEKKAKTAVPRKGKAVCEFC